jgi:acetyl esterase/lipase
MTAAPISADVLDNQPGTSSLLAALHFTLEMDPALHEVLAGSPMLLGPDVLTDLPAWRAAIAALGQTVAALPTPYDQQVWMEDVFIPTADETGQLRLRLYRPVQSVGLLPVFYWMHGGGLLGGTPEQDEGQMKQIAAATGALVVSVNYRLAPEFPFPTPLDDCYAGLLWVTDHAHDLGIDEQKIAVGGASAGGGLAAALAQRVHQTGGPRLVHQSLTYPMLDDRNLTNSSREITSLGLWDRVHNITGWQAYLGGNSAGRAVPEFAAAARATDLSGLPSTFIGVGSLDLFRDENLEYALRLMAAGVSTEVHFYAGAVHGFDWHIPDSPMARGFLQKRIQALQLAYAG